MTDAEKIRLLPWGIAADSLTTVFGYLTVFGNPFILMLSVLGLPKAQIGALLSLLPFFGVTSLLTAGWVARIGFKRAFLIFWSARYVLCLFLLLLPGIVERGGTRGAFVFLAVVLGGFALCRAIGETAGYPWSQETIPGSVRAKYIAVDTTVASLIGALSIAVAGWVIGPQPTLRPFMVLIAVGVVFGLAGVWCVSHLPGGAPLRDQPEAVSAAGLLEALRNPNFANYLVALAFFNLTNGIGSFVPLYLEREIGLTPAVIVWLQIAGLAGTVLTSFFWGWAADRYGGKPVVLTVLPFMALIPAVYFFMPRQSPASAPVAALLFAVGNALWMAWWLGTNRLLFVRIVPPERKTQYMAVHYAWMGLTGGAAPLLGGWALDQLKNLSGSFFGFPVDQYSPLWAVNVVLVLLTLLFISRVQAAGELGLRRFTGLFIQGHPLLAAEALIRHSLAVAEETRVATAEMMARAKSPLSVEELTQALHDPSFSVRQEAIVALAHLSPDERIVEALVEVLQGRQPDLAVSAAWALGRLGDPRALPPLRQALDSDFPMVRAAAARALGNLRDVESRQAILERMRQVTHPALRTAYAASLGRLRCREALPDLLEFMREPSDSAEELVLALARLVGAERHFINLWRGTRAGLGPGAAAAIRAWRGRLRRLQRRYPDLADTAEAAERHFLADRLEQGVAAVRSMIGRLREIALPEPLPTVLAACDARLAEYGASYKEWLLLAVHTLGVALSHLAEEAERDAPPRA